MNNKILISKERIMLANNGIIADDENINTKNTWRKMGYKVNNGEKPVTTIPIFVFVPFKSYNKDGKCITTKKMLRVRANFYTTSQVTEIQKGA